MHKNEHRRDRDTDMLYKVRVNKSTAKNNSNTLQVLLKYCLVPFRYSQSTLGVLLRYSWSIFEVPLEYCSGTHEAPLEYRSETHVYTFKVPFSRPRCTIRVQVKGLSSIGMKTLNKSTSKVHSRSFAHGSSWSYVIRLFSGIVVSCDMRVKMEPKYAVILRWHSSAFSVLVLLDSLLVIFQPT